MSPFFLSFIVALISSFVLAWFTPMWFAIAVGVLLGLSASLFGV